MIEFEIQENISKIIKEYSNLSLLPFFINVSSVHRNFYDTDDENKIYFKVLQSLINMTDVYKKICHKNGDYLLYLYIDGEKVKYECSVEMKNI